MAVREVDSAVNNSHARILDLALMLEVASFINFYRNMATSTTVENIEEDKIDLIWLVSRVLDLTKW